MKNSPTKSILDKFSQHSSFLAILEKLRTNRKVSLNTTNSSALSFFIATLSRSLKNKIIITSPEEEELDNISRDLLTFSIKKDQVSLLPCPPDQEAFLKDSQATINFSKSIVNLLTKQKAILLARTENLLQEIPKPESILSVALSLTINQTISQDKIIRFLVENGYEMSDFTEDVFSFSRRGYILDFFPPYHDFPIRIEFFGDTITSIRYFDTETQRSLKKLKNIVIYPEIISLKAKEKYPLPRIIPTKSIIIFLHHDRHRDNYEKIQSLLPDKVKTITVNDLQDPEYTLPFFIPNGKNRFSSFIKEILEIEKKDRNPTILIFSDTPTQSKHIQQILKTRHINTAQIISNPLHESFFIPEQGVYIFSTSYFSGKKISTYRQLPKTVKESYIEQLNLENLNPGDYLVHSAYGIGKFQGLQKIYAFGAERECLVLEYRGGDKLYVPVENFNQLNKYYGTGKTPPLLNKLGSGEWERLKSATRKTAEKIVRELVEIYAKRLNSKGHSFSPDTELQLEMESEFAFEETPDQIKAIEQIKEDMEKPYPMDRLLCGDVGFGKTEVALRAAFKAVCDSKQVAFLVPTTILAEQHYRTFKERLKNYPINIEVLSRFIPKDRQRKIIEKVKSGIIDILIGTHRILSKDICFKNLGLLIIDEEQRFGVKQKEHFKKLRLNIDVLSLSATPIPRTLYLSLIGARDISLINTPPKFRHPIHTEIINFDIEKIKDGVYREISRGGQIYFVHDRVNSIISLTEKLKKIFPDLEINFVHGQMPPRKIEDTMHKFINRKVDLLVTTPIIESGIDLPNVNTIFINNAHNFGLSQLYQLRGRVGRGTRKAFAYLIVNKPSQLSETALKRLIAIKKFTALGSGYQIALKDIEVRGAGNVFGLEQSGHINAIGYDMYIRILKEALETYRTNSSKQKEKAPLESEFEVDISFPLPCLIPSSYISNDSIRIFYYKKISAATEPEEIKFIFEDIRDKFGPPPSEVINLLNLFTTRLLCQKLMFEKVSFRENSVLVKFDRRSPLLNNHPLEILKKLHSETRIGFKFTPEDRYSVILFIRKHNIKELNEFLLKLLYNLNLKRVA